VPVRFYRTIDSYDWRVAATRRAYGWTGHELGEPTLYLWGAPVGKVKFVPKWRSRIADSLSRTAQVPTFLQTGEVWAQVAERARAVRPRFMVGYASSLLNFARYAEQNGLKFDGLVSVISAAEGLQDAARAYVQRVLGAPVFNTYGSREFMSIGVECDRHCGMHVNSENVLVETADGDSDASAPLLVTDLHNLGTVFLRYAIGDAGAITAAPCACGRALPRLTSLGGRTLDVLTLANGRTVNALYFFHLLKEIPEILAFQIKQTEPNALEARVVLSRELSEASRTLFETETKKVVGDARIELRRVDELETGASGKVKVVIGLGRTA
jgi:phenylacetate-CoA ligase